MISLKNIRKNLKIADKNQNNQLDFHADIGYNLENHPQNSKNADEIQNERRCQYEKSG